MDSLVLTLIQIGFLFVYVVNSDQQGWVHYNNHYYYYSNAGDKPIPADAKSKCLALGADLLSIADIKEQSSINLNISTGYSIGLRPVEGTDAAQRKNWYWLDGTEYDVNKFHNWDNDYPHSVATSKCGRLFNNGTWRNNNCTGTPYQYICKKQDPCVPGASICNNGNCSVVHNETQYYCDCWAGYTGQQCETNINECDSSPCVHGNCIDNINGYWCDCSGTGFEGEHCDKDINECEENILVCENSGSCVNTDGGAHCDCVPGTTGVQCKTDINECSEQLHECVNGTCHNFDSSYKCNCTDGFVGDFCEFRNDTLQQIDCDKNEASTCTTTIIAFSIICAILGTIVIIETYFIYKRLRNMKASRCEDCKLANTNGRPSEYVNVDAAREAPNLYQSTDTVNREEVNIYEDLKFSNQST